MTRQNARRFTTSLGRTIELVSSRDTSPNHRDACLGPHRLAVLYVDDEEANLELFRLTFGDDFDVRTASSGAHALQLMEQNDIGLLLTDERMPGMSGIELLAQVHMRWPETVRIIVSAYTDADRLFRAINRGQVNEYVVKPWSAEEMRISIQRGLAQAARLRQVMADAAIGEAVTADLRFEHNSRQLIGAHSGLKDVVSAAWKAAQCNTTVLIRGETGTGKELIARLIHEQSLRASGPFVPINCGAVPEDLLASELFGHERGAFTGALTMRRGRFELARGGTIFLDEIGEISPKLQVRLLRVLQEQRIEHLGSSESHTLDARVVAATHRNLEQLVRKHAFREDLFFRLNVFPIAIPPLRERPGDIGPLLDHFIAKHSRGRCRSASSEAREVLTRYNWPGNVRELENLVQRALVLSHEDELQLEDFCLTFGPSGPGGPGGGVRNGTSEREAERLRELLIKHGGNIARAARDLDIPRTTFVSRVKKYGYL